MNWILSFIVDNALQIQQLALLYHAFYVSCVVAQKKIVLMTHKLWDMYMWDKVDMQTTIYKFWL